MSAVVSSAQNLSSDFFPDFALSFDNMRGTAAAASKAQPNIGRNRIQPIAITTNENEVAIATQAKLTPSAMISRTIGIQETEIIEILMRITALRKKFLIRVRLYKRRLA